MGKRQLVLNIPVELRRWLEQRAAEESRSLNYIASQVLEKARAEQQAEAV